MENDPKIVIDLSRDATSLQETIQALRERTLKDGVTLDSCREIHSPDLLSANSTEEVMKSWATRVPELKGKLTLMEAKIPRYQIYMCQLALQPEPNHVTFQWISPDHGPDANQEFLSDASTFNEYYQNLNTIIIGLGGCRGSLVRSPIPRPSSSSGNQERLPITIEPEGAYTKLRGDILFFNFFADGKPTSPQDPPVIELDSLLSILTSDEKMNALKNRPINGERLKAVQNRIPPDQIEFCSLALEQNPDTVIFSGTGIYFEFAKTRFLDYAYGLTMYHQALDAIIKGTEPTKQQPDTAKQVTSTEDSKLYQDGSRQHISQVSATVDCNPTSPRSF